jgi:pimeloyl-ACP methyl ester carboxylesterase
MPNPSPYANLLDSVPCERRNVDVLGSTTRCWIYGPADASTTILAVHGFRGDHHGLEPIVAQLPGIRIVSPDLPGFGESTPLREGAHDIAGYRAWLSGLVDRLGLGSDFVLLGHSFGSIVASAAMAGGGSVPPLPASKLVLVNPIAAPALAGPRGVLTRLAVLYYRLGAVLPERLGFGLLRNRVIVRGMSVAMAKTKDAALRRWIHAEHDRYFSGFADRRTVLEAFRASVSSDVSHFAADIAVPTLLVAADRDDITDVAAQHRLAARFPKAELVVLSDVGHLIHYEKPVEAANAIRRFLAS